MELHHLQAEWDALGAITGFRRTVAQIRLLARSQRESAAGLALALALAALLGAGLWVVTP